VHLNFSGAESLDFIQTPYFAVIVALNKMFDHFFCHKLEIVLNVSHLCCDFRLLFDFVVAWYSHSGFLQALFCHRDTTLLNLLMDLTIAGSAFPGCRFCITNLF